MSVMVFLGVMLGVFNLILNAVVIFILKQPNPNQGRELHELQELQERIGELSKHLVGFEKKLEKTIHETKSENLGKLDKVSKELGRHLQDIHDNL